MKTKQQHWKCEVGKTGSADSRVLLFSQNILPFTGDLLHLLHMVLSQGHYKSQWG